MATTNNQKSKKTVKTTIKAKGNNVTVAPTKEELKQHKEFIANFLNNA